MAILHRNNVIINTFFILGTCLFFTYQLQDYALTRTDDYARELNRPPILPANMIEPQNEVEVIPADENVVRDGCEELIATKTRQASENSGNYKLDKFF